MADHVMKIIPHPVSWRCNLNAKMQPRCPEIILHHRDIVTSTALYLVVEIHAAMNNCQPRSQMMGEPWIHGKKSVFLCFANAREEYGL